MTPEDAPPPPLPDGLAVTSLASGSSGNCFAVSYRGDVLLVDAGLSYRKTAAALRRVGIVPEQVIGLYLTHEHGDHVSGAGPVARRLKVPVHATHGTFTGARRRLGKLPTKQIHPFENGRPLEVGPFTLHPFPTFHDVRDASAVAVEAPGGRRVGVLTDIGEVTTGTVEALAGCSALLLEWNHDVDMLRHGPYPWHLKERIASCEGHLSNSDAARLVTALAPRGLRRVLAAHLSNENNSPEVVARTYDALVPGSVRADLELAIAPRYRPSVTLEA